MKFVTSIALLLLLVLNIKAQTTTSVSDGTWNTNANWSNRVPADRGIATVNHLMILNTNLTINNGNYTVTDAGKITDPSGGADYNIDVRGTGSFTVSGTVIIGGDLEIRNSGSFILKGCDTMIVNGDVRFSNQAEVTIESCAVLIINGDLDIRNNNTTNLDGNIVVAGDLTSRNSAVIVGTGNLQTKGEVDIRNSSSIFGSTTPCRTGPCDYGVGSGLPIELLDFSANYSSCKQIELRWSTASEINNNYFTLETSLDGIVFSELAKLRGAGNSSKELHYDYRYSVKNGNSTRYFRLTQTDYDGAYEVFDVIALNPTNELDCKKELKLNAYPNPGNGSDLTLDISGLNGNQATLLIHNMNGVLLYEEAINGSDTMGIKLSQHKRLEPGVYFITLLNDGKKTSFKYLVV